jgi:hypothetical protein
VLTCAGEELLRAVAPVVLGPLVDARGAAAPAALDAAIEALDDYLAHLSAPLQRQARVTLTLLSSPPARVALLRSPRPWRAAPPVRIESALAGLRGSRAGSLRRLYGFLHSLVVLGWFDLPLAWEEIGYPGPPAESAAAAQGAR